MNSKTRKETGSPIALFKQWLKEAGMGELNNPNACTLATADKFSRPSVRMVLLKNVDDRGFVFYTNSQSQKGIELLENPRASLCFHWKSLGKEVRINGSVIPVSEDENVYSGVASLVSDEIAFTSARTGFVDVLM